MSSEQKKTEPSSTARRDTLRAVESDVQKKWDDAKIHEKNAPVDGEPAQEKFFVTFPFPYMNGRLHLGHGFSMTKSEFASRYWQMKGKRALWPFGFHVTGTPIAACAQKIAKEMELYGNPPQFPEEVLEGKEKKKEDGVEAIGKHKSKRGKTGPAKPQWIIMRSMGIPEDEIHRFSDPRYWLDYFPPIAMKDLHDFGCNIDFRRSFITTDVSPFFDSFVSWQFRHLQNSGFLHFGKRHCVYSPWDKQPCADHDRASGEGAGPQEYTLVKLKVKEPLSQESLIPFKDIIGDRAVVFPGATLRPETVVGLTNCWVSPDITYQAYTVRNKKGEDEIFIMTSRAARNIVYQDFVVNGEAWKDPTPLFEIDGEKLIGLPLSGPHAPYETIYTLPMHTITEAKGTGIVMSVPTDSPDDYINLTQLVKKPEYRAKLGLKDEWVLPFEIVPILELPGDLGTFGAKVACEQLKINGPNATDLLEEAKKIVYQAGFYHGVMIAGPFAGKKVSEAKVLMSKLMEDNDEAIRYFEPVRQVMSRSGDECVVALCDQWYIEYGKEEWKKVVLEHLDSMNMFFPGVRNGFEQVLNWLSDWPCSRTFGLGTKLPGDASHTMIIDSLSDSTIYMAYYTVAHFLHVAKDGTHTLDASKPNVLGVTPEMFKDEAWEYVLRGVGTPESVLAATGMPAEASETMRKEFLYWYPVDLRCSAKDLIQNHLTEFLYNHAAIWPDDRSKWPRAIFCNGHIQVDGEKMAKSKGNFISMRESIDLYGADATRLACADAGDSLDDANFVRETASSFILKLTTMMELAKDLMSKASTELRTGEYNVFDKIFDNTLNTCILKVDEYYRGMQFRMVLNSAFHEIGNDFSQYRLTCDELKPHADLVRRYFEVVTLLLSPLAPHFADHMWCDILGHSEMVATASFPQLTGPVQYSMLVANRAMTDVVKEIRAQVIKNAKKRGPITEVCVYTATDFLPWQRSALELLRTVYEENGKVFPADLTKQVMAQKPAWMEKDLIPDAMAFIAFVKANADKYGEEALSQTPTINDLEVLTSVKANIAKLSGVENVHILSRDDETYPEHKAARRKCRPGEPSVAFPPQAK